MIVKLKNSSSKSWIPIADEIIKIIDIYYTLKLSDEDKNKIREMIEIEREKYITKLDCIIIRTLFFDKLGKTDIKIIYNPKNKVTDHDSELFIESSEEKQTDLLFIDLSEL